MRASRFTALFIDSSIAFLIIGEPTAPGFDNNV